MMVKAGTEKGKWGGLLASHMEFRASPPRTEASWSLQSNYR